MTSISLRPSELFRDDPTALHLFEISCFLLALLPYRFFNKGDERVWHFAMNEWKQRMDLFLREEMSDFEKESRPSDEPQKEEPGKTKKNQLLVRTTRFLRGAFARAGNQVFKAVKNFIKVLKRILLLGIVTVENIIEQSKRKSATQKGTMIDNENRYRHT